MQSLLFLNSHFVCSDEGPYCPLGWPSHVRDGGRVGRSGSRSLLTSGGLSLIFSSIYFICISLHYVFDLDSNFSQILKTIFLKLINKITLVSTSNKLISLCIFSYSMLNILPVLKVTQSPLDLCVTWVTELDSPLVITPWGLALKYWSEIQCHHCGSLITLCWGEYQPGWSAKVQDAILHHSDNLQTFGVLIFPSLPWWPLPNLKVHLGGIWFGQNGELSVTEELIQSCAD